MESAKARPAPTSVSEAAEASRDPRVALLEEWEAVQSLCESLADAGRARGAAPVLPGRIVPNTRL